jgi:hypothetical protein
MTILVQTQTRNKFGPFSAFFLYFCQMFGPRLSRLHTIFSAPFVFCGRNFGPLATLHGGSKPTNFLSSPSCLNKQGLLRPAFTQERQVKRRNRFYAVFSILPLGAKDAISIYHHIVNIVLVLNNLFRKVTSCIDHICVMYIHVLKIITIKVTLTRKRCAK